MFREGLGLNGFRGIVEDGASKTRTGTRWSIANRKLDAKPVSNPSNVHQGFGLSSLAELRNRHFPSSAPALAQSVPVNGNDGGLGSDMDIASDSDDEIYGRHRSLESSPQDDKLPIGAAQKVPRAYAADESSNSATSTEVSYEMENGEVRNKKFSRNDVPSAPPVGLGSETMGNVYNGTASTYHSGNASVESAAELDASASSLPSRFPTFHASGQGPWCAVIAYDACVRLCLHSWASGGAQEAAYFLNNECTLLRNAFGLQKVLLQSEEELLAAEPSELVSGTAVPKSKKMVGKIKVQVRRIKMGLDPPPGCSFSSLKLSTERLEILHQHVSVLNSTLSSGWKAMKRVRVTPNVPSNGSFSQQSLAYLQASTQYIKQVTRALRNEIVTSHNEPQSYEIVQETYSCLLRLKSTPDEDLIKMQPGSRETYVFLSDSLGDDLIIEIKNSKGQCCGRVLAQLAAVFDEPNAKLRWWPIYHEPEHELVGRMQLYINYSSHDDYTPSKCGSVAETLAYDLVLEVAMKAENFQQRNLLLNGHWKWIVSCFASYYGVSDAYTKLRYLSYVMDVATPTKDCLDLIHELLLPVITKGKSVLSHQENRMLGEIDEQVQQILALAFENYKSLDESSPSGIRGVFEPATGSPAPALAPAVKLYGILSDVLSPEAQLKLCRYFQAASKKRARRYLSETDDLIVSSNEAAPMDPVAFSTSYQKMKSLILSLKNEIWTNILIHNCNVLPSFIDLPNISAAIYSVDLCNRLREFLVACPPSSPSPLVVELVIASADFQNDLSSWNINSIKGGVDAKELFHSYISAWIKHKRGALLDFCKLDMVKGSGEETSFTSPFVDEMYDRLKETLDEYDIIIRRWPEYAITLEKVIADTERAIIDSLEKQFADVLSLLKDNKIFGLKYVQKFAKGTINPYSVPNELGILLNSVKRMLDILRPSMEIRIKAWNSCFPDGDSQVLGERLTEVTVLLRAKFRSYMQAIVEKLAENTRIQSSLKLKNIIQDLRQTMVESDVRNRMQPLKDLLVCTIDHLHLVFLPDVFIALCRGIWDRMGQDVLRLLEDRKDNMTWHKGPRIAISVLDDIFASQMQQLIGNALKEEHLQAPRSIMEIRSMLCKDAVDYRNNYYY